MATPKVQAGQTMEETLLAFGREVIRERAEAVLREAAEEKLKWFTTVQAAKHLGVSKRTLERHYRVDWAIPCCVVDGMKRFLRQDLDTFLLAHRTCFKTRSGAEILNFPSAAA